MPGLSLFLPALLGGFLFVSNFYVTRLWIKRREGYSLILAASVAGGILWFVSHIAWAWLEMHGCCNGFLNAWNELVPVEYSLGSASSFALGMVLPLAFNWFSKIPCLSTERVHKRHITARADPFEVLIHNAMEEQSPVAVTLKSGKVYVGRIIARTNPAFSVDSVSMTLIRSGFRKSETHELCLNVDYEDAMHQSARNSIREQYSELISHALEKVSKSVTSIDASELADSIFEQVFGKVNIEPDQIPFSVVIMAREIQSMTPFDLGFFDEHFNAAKPD